MNEKQLLTSAIEYGILSEEAVSNIENMIKKNEVLKVHKYAITPPSKNNKRWATHVPDKSAKEHRRRVYKPTEKDLFDYLYDFYHGLLDDQRTTLKTVYPLWVNYKLAICNRPNTVYRIDLDWKKYYLHEPLSQDLISKPIEEITRADVRMWSHQLVKKHDMTRKKYMNVQTILKQVFRYLIDNETLDKDPTDLLKIEPTMFRRTVKKEAETQIFYQDEIEEIITKATELAEETNDETYLAIPMFFLTGVRIGEILALGHDDFDRERSSVFIHRSLCTQVTMNDDRTWSKRSYVIEEHLKKNAEPRTVLVPAKVFDLVKRVRVIQLKKGKLDNYLFHVKTPHVVTGKLYRICDSLGISRRSPHKCRKTYISTLLNKGVDPDFVREQAGHRDLQTTLNSYAYSTTRNEDKVAQLEEILAI